VFCVVRQSNFAAVLSANAWLERPATGLVPERDNLHAVARQAQSAAA